MCSALRKSRPYSAQQIAERIPARDSTAISPTPAHWLAQPDCALGPEARVDSIDISPTSAVSRRDSASLLEHAEIFPDARRASMSADAEDTAQILKLDLPMAPTVLIVDDDELVLARLQELVVAAGYPVRTAGNGIEALKSLEQSAASVVVTDLNMP